MSDSWHPSICHRFRRALRYRTIPIVGARSDCPRMRSTASCGAFPSASTTPNATIAPRARPRGNPTARRPRPRSVLRGPSEPTARSAPSLRPSQRTTHFPTKRSPSSEKPAHRSPRTRKLERTPPPARARPPEPVRIWSRRLHRVKSLRIRRLARRSARPPAANAERSTRGARRNRLRTDARSARIRCPLPVVNRGTT